MRRLKNKVALVTGGSRGIGEVIVYALAEEGANVGINYVRSQNKAEEVRQNVINRHGVEAVAIKADVSKPEEVQEMTKQMLAKFGHIDLLVNNAGLAIQEKLADTSIADWNITIATDLTGIFLCTRAVLPFMLQQKEGKIINIASTLGQIGEAGMVAYSAAKGGVIAFTKALAREVARDGVLVNCIAPGPIETEIVKSYSKDSIRNKKNSIPLGRFGLPKEVASVVVFLASDDGNIFIGQTLGPNSGETML
jgi:3-oxoacyl-[acyl-carrier protein] reductase